MVATPGNLLLPMQNQIQVVNDPNAICQQATIVDESYMVIGNQVDDLVRKKIINHKYVDFAKLLSKDRLNREEDNQMELMSRGGCMYFIPVSDREPNGSVSSFSKWEQAFRAFSNIYTQVYPSRATELIQYNHLIYTASLSFTWDNVYRYDKEFHLHMSNFPHHNWGMILQQAWSVYLKDRVTRFMDDKPNGKKKEICKRFNKGKCTAGYHCNYDHRCLNCGKFGHGAHICHNKKSGNDSQAHQSPSASTPVNGQPTSK